MKVMPISGYFDREKWETVRAFTIPFEMLVPHDKQAKANHCGQDLNRLWERHGMSACEAIAILEDRKWHRMIDKEAAEKLKQMVKEYEERNSH
jgi:hypothetical protein